MALLTAKSAERLGVAAGTSKSQLHKAHVELRGILGRGEHRSLILADSLRHDPDSF